MPYIPLIGRERELNQIDNRITSHSDSEIVCISGPGGIGKTRLLQEVLARYDFEFNSSENKNYIFSQVVSFDDPSLHLAENVRRLIIRSLGAQHFRKYLEALSDWYKMKDAGIGRERLAQEESNVDNSFISDFNAISLKKRTVLLFDTIDEEMVGTDSWNYLISLFPKLENVVILAAGRVVEKFYDNVSSLLGERSCLIPLHPFDDIASIEYFQRKQKQLHISIDPSISSRIIKLAKGRPILIDLAVEWMARDIPLPWLEVDIPENKFEALEAEFEKKLISPVGELRSTIDRLILLTSYIYPISDKFVSFLFNLDISEVQSLFKTVVKDYIYFKPVVHGQLTLHDEVRRMITKWIWPELDPFFDRRRNYSARFIEYASTEADSMRQKINKDPLKHYRNPINDTLPLSPIFQEEIDQEDLWALESLRLKHTLRVDAQKGFELFEDLYQKSTAEYLFSVRHSLLIMMDKSIDKFTSDQCVSLNIFKAEANLESGKVELAYDTLINYKETVNITPSLQIRALQTLANCSIRLSHIDEADKVLNTALQLSISNNFPALRGQVELTLGWLRRLQGRWEQANKLYLSALNYCFQAEDLLNAGLLLNSIGYIHQLKGDYSTGRSSCLQALDIFERLSRLREKAMVYSTLGDIYTSSEQFEEAMKSYFQALEIFEAREDWEWICIVKHEIAYSLWVQNKYEDALKYIQESLSIAKTRHINKELPIIMYHMGWIQWDHIKFEGLGDAEYEISISYFQQSYEESIRYQNKFIQLSDLVAFADLSYMFGKFEKVPGYAKELKTEISENKLDYPLLEGQMERTQGNIDYDLAQSLKQTSYYNKALLHYTRGIPLIAKHGGTGRNSLFNELLFLGDRIDDLEPNIAIEWCQTMRKKWITKRDVLLSHPELLNFCDVHLALAKSRLAKNYRN